MSSVFLILNKYPNLTNFETQKGFLQFRDFYMPKIASYIMKSQNQDQTSTGLFISTDIEIFFSHHKMNHFSTKL